MTYRIAISLISGATRALLLAALVTCTINGCPSAIESEELTHIVNITAEDFGTGVMLFQTSQAAKSSGGYSSLEKWVLTREELLGKNPYADKPEGKDLVIAITSQYFGDANEFNDPTPKVLEIRAFSDSEKSKLTLQGQLLVELSPAAVEELFGKPLSLNQGSDGNTHLSFLLAAEEESDFRIRLVTSHRINGRCYAVSFAVEPGK